MIPDWKGALVLTALVVTSGAIGAQGSPSELRYAPDLTIDLAKAGVKSPGPLFVNRRGHMIVVNQFPGEVVRFDSLAGKRVWPISVHRRGGDVGQISGSGWVGDSMWVADDVIDQLAVIDSTGTLVESIERFNWIRPAWGDRRKYPLFAAMEWLALYPDGSQLVRPSKPRALFDSPQYDRSRLHLLRVDHEGRILRTVAKIPSTEPRMLLRDAMEREVVPIPFFAKPAWTVSADGQRIVVVQPLLTASDSGAFVVTSLNAAGDTVFSRRFTVTTTRVPADEVEKVLVGLKSFGRYSAGWIRDTLRKQIPVFRSRISNVTVGIDHSVWVHLHSDVPEHSYFVIDPHGNAAGTVGFPSPWRVAALSLDRIWTLQRVGTGRTFRPVNIVRLKREETTAARLARSASAGASRR